MFQRSLAGYYGPTARRPEPIGAPTRTLAIISAAYWLVAARTSPFPPELRGPAAVGLLITSLVLFAVFLRTWFAFGGKVYDSLVRREDLGGRLRIVLWFTAWFAYAVAVLLLVGGILVLVSS